jgi:hypothetical protein
MRCQDDEIDVVRANEPKSFLRPLHATCTNDRYDLHLFDGLRLTLLVGCEANSMEQGWFEFPNAT